MIIDDIKQANIAAMKNRDSIARGALAIVMTKYKNMEVEMKAQGKEIGDAEILSIIQKTLKELSDEKEGYLKVGNLARAEDILKQEDLLSCYLPKQLSVDDIKAIIMSLDDKSIPSVMKHFKSNYSGQVDMSLVNQVLRSL